MAAKISIRTRHNQVSDMLNMSYDDINDFLPTFNQKNDVFYNHCAHIDVTYGDFCRKSTLFFSGRFGRERHNWKKVDPENNVP